MIPPLLKTPFAGLCCLWLWAAALFLSGQQAALAADGLFATLQTTMGEIRIRLEFEEAPRTVANFVTLAEGSRPWVDLDRGRSSTAPFYNGLVFHRVFSNVVIQTGAPGAVPSRGPGYRFNDEFSTNLRHSVTGAVSMANRGPNSNGSQFFITLRPTPGLDFDQPPLSAAHAVFGYVVDGLDTALAIGSVPTQPPGDGRPLVDITITNVAIERIGAAAEAFDPAAVTPPLPVVRDSRSSIRWTETGDLLLTWPWQASHVYWAVGSLNLEQEAGWAPITASSVAASGLNITGLGVSFERLFFSVMEAQTFEAPPP